MRRFSQRNALVTLSEINITPLLDLAFVLLIIFVITTPLLEQGLDLTLPTGGRKDDRIEQRDIKTVEVGQSGLLMLNRSRMTLPQIERELVSVHRANPNLVVYVRGDENAPLKHVASILDMLERNRIKRVSLRTFPPK